MPSLGGVLSGLGDELKGAAEDAWNHVRADSQQFIDKSRQDLANAIGDIGTGAVNAVTGTVAPANKAPVSVPLTTSRMTALAVAGVGVLVVVVILARRR